VKPGQLTPNGFEKAILQAIARDQPDLLGRIQALHVLSREFTGVGSFTKFSYGEASESPRHHLSLDALISLPGVPGGMGATLHMLGYEPECLEVYTFGTEAWDGTIEGFSIASAA
jgi:hypothetical protein